MLTRGNGDRRRSSGFAGCNGSIVGRDAVERSRGGLALLGFGGHVVGQPEVVGSALGDGIFAGEGVVGRERGRRACLIDVEGIKHLGIRAFDVERSDDGRREFALSLDSDAQHADVGLSLQHFADADVLGCDGGDGDVGLLVSFGLDGEVRTRIAALTDILDGELATVEVGIGDDGVELS